MSTHLRYYVMCEAYTATHIYYCAVCAPSLRAARDRYAQRTSRRDAYLLRLAKHLNAPMIRGAILRWQAKRRDEL